MPNVFFIFLLLLGSAPAASTPQNTFVGCLNRLPDGMLQFGAVPSGQIFFLHGEENAQADHVNQLIRVSGDVSQSDNNSNAPATISVVQIRTLAGSCTSALPTKTTDRAAGKVGEDLVAVPVTSTLAGDQTTPGFQTQPATVQPQSLRESSFHESPASPAHPDQVAQSEAAANVNANSVDRTEILPGRTLGVSGSAGTTARKAAENNLANPGNSNSHRNSRQPAGDVAIAR